MFFILSKLLRFLLTPVSWMIILAVLAVWKKKKGYVKISLGVLLFFTNPLIADVLLKAWELDPVDISGQQYSVAVVLTGMTNTAIQIPGQIQFSEGVDRMTEALKLYKGGVVKKILISGGSGSLTHPAFTESPALAQFAMDLGVPEEDILVESKSRNTHENAKFTKEVLAKHSASNDTVLLITSAFHMRRSLGCFEKQGMTFTAYPVDYRYSGQVDYTSFVPSSDALKTWDTLISEWVGVIMYRMMGYI